ncbi:MAG: TIGR02186 family protein [Desulfatiglandaceae bacterium]
MLKKLFPVIVVFLICSAGWCPDSPMAALPMQMKLKPNHIFIGATFNGARISVTGNVPANSEVLIRLMGPFENTKLKKKGRALGFLWMNMGAVEFQNIPSVFLLFPSNALEKSLKNDSDEWRKIGLGFGALEKQAKIIPASEDKQKLFKEFRKLKESAGRYEIQKNKVRYGETHGSTKTFTATMSIPSGMPKGSYKAQVFAIKNGSVVTSAEEHIIAEETGFPATLSFLAFHHGTLYGVLAVLVAIIAGLVTGLVFKGGKGGH